MGAANVTLSDLAADVVTVKQATVLLRVQRRSVYQMITDGRLPEPLRLGRQLYWTSAEFEAAVSAMRGYRRRPRKETPVASSAPSGAS